MFSSPLLPAKALHVSGVFEMSSSEPMDSVCSVYGLFRGGGKGEISVSFVSWASVSLRRRRLRLLLGVVRDRRDTAFFMAGLSFWSRGEWKENEKNKIILKKESKTKANYIYCNLWNG